MVLLRRKLFFQRISVIIIFEQIRRILLIKGPSRI